MSQILTPSLQIRSKKRIVKLRELPVTGEILVEQGQKVQSGTRVARAFLPGDLHILRLPEKMGLQVFEVLQGIKCKEGDQVKEGDLLCSHAGLLGLFKSEYRAGIAGEVEFITEKTGHIGLREPARPIELTAYIAGEVQEVIEDKAVKIASDSAYIQGIFGIGGEKTGILEVVAGLDEILNSKHVPQDCQNKVIAGGMQPSIEILNLLADRGAVGLITGSLDDRLIKEYLGYDLGIALTGDEEVPVTVIMTEGFGSLAMSRRCYRLLKELDGHEVSINGATQVRAGAVRPEIIIPHNKEFAVQADGNSGLSIGSVIRIIRFPYFGKRAEVVELPASAEQIETGAKTRVLKAKLEDSDEVVTVPRANVEIV